MQKNDGFASGNIGIKSQKEKNHVLLHMWVLAYKVFMFMNEQLKRECSTTFRKETRRADISWCGRLVKHRQEDSIGRVDLQLVILVSTSSSRPSFSWSISALKSHWQCV